MGKSFSLRPNLKVYDLDVIRRMIWKKMMEDRRKEGIVVIVRGDRIVEIG